MADNQLIYLCFANSCELENNNKIKLDKTYPISAKKSFELEQFETCQVCLTILLPKTA